MASKSRKNSVPTGERVELLTTAQAGRILGISAQRVRRLVRLSELPFGRSGRKWLLGFREIAFLRQVLRLNARARGKQKLLRAIEACKARSSTGRGKGKIRFHEAAGDFVVQESSGYRDPVSGQFFLPFPEATGGDSSKPAIVMSLGELRAKVQDGAHDEPSERWYALAVAREEAGDLDGAQQAYLNALRLDPSLSDACVNLGRLAHQRGAVRRAAHWYRRAIAISPDDPIAHYNLAIALEDLGDFAGAIVEYRHALDRDWEFPEAHFNLSRLLRALGQQLAAMRHLRIYRQLTGLSGS
ncbi:MAG: hypothetical protein KatS3mg077_0204 [Candidatus Binatia bacterium]|nr:MAG: hypothetical protein KatS3mg077_0204 [Candidatus Binatia bacterium]